MFIQSRRLNKGCMAKYACIKIMLCFCEFISDETILFGIFGIFTKNESATTSGVSRGRSIYEFWTRIILARGRFGLKPGKISKKNLQNSKKWEKFGVCKK